MRSESNAVHHHFHFDISLPVRRPRLGKIKECADHSVCPAQKGILKSVTVYCAFDYIFIFHTSWNRVTLQFSLDKKTITSIHTVID